MDKESVPVRWCAQLTNPQVQKEAAAAGKNQQQQQQHKVHLVLVRLEWEVELLWA